MAELLTTAILAGLPTYWQNPKDGSLDNSIPLGWWNLPSRKAYFATCRINPAEPATGAAPSPWQSYIFVNGESLYQLIATYRAELAKRLAAAQPEAVAWWPGQPRGAAKAWIFRPAVQAEALARLGDTRTKDAYVRALDAMQNEAPSDPWKPGTIGRTLRKYPEAWPADLT